MPRPRRNFVPGRMYLVAQQGNKQSPICVDDQDRGVASSLLKKCALRYSVEVLAFAYGEWEGRWLLRPSSRRGISNMMRDMQSSYSRYLNRKYHHRPCCAQRIATTGSACHPDATPIAVSSNWTPRFQVTEIAQELQPFALAYIAELSRRVTTPLHEVFAASFRRSCPLERLLTTTSSRRAPLTRAAGYSPPSG